MYILKDRVFNVKWRSDFEKGCICMNFERRGWQKWRESDHDDWNIYWASVYSAKQVFSSDNHTRLGDHQLINHFPNHYELTRKDLMVKNLKRYKKEIQREGGDTSVLDFVPTTFVLPGDYALFVEEYRRHPNSTWILKPSARAQGKGIFIINKLSQVRKWYATQWPGAIKVNSSDCYVVSKYIQNPLLIGGKKFDLRLYVCVRSYRPLKAFKSSLCFARFCNYKYNDCDDDLDNAFVHLTNVAVQKHSEGYNENHGGKWPLKSLRFYLASHYGEARTQKLFDAIDAIVVNTLKACQGVMINDRHCFELYGYDIIVDENLKPWLIEVNASPSLSATTEADRILKFKLINDTLQCVVPRVWLKGAGGGGSASSSSAASYYTGGSAASSNGDGNGAVVGTTNLVHGGSTPARECGSFTILHDEMAEQQERLRLRRESMQHEHDRSYPRPRWNTWGSAGSASGASARGSYNSSGRPYSRH